MAIPYIRTVTLRWFSATVPFENMHQERKAKLDKFNPFSAPKEAVEAGHASFRPVSGWRREYLCIS